MGGARSRQAVHDRAAPVLRGHRRPDVFGDSPIEVPMAAGTYAAEVTCDGQTKRQTFSIAAGQTSKVQVRR